MASNQQVAIWRFVGREVRESDRELVVDGRPAPIERKPFEVLLYLLAHAGEVVTREELHEKVWPGRIISDTVLSRTILKLRRALKDDAHQIVATVHGYGYRLVAPVERLADGGAGASRLDLRPGMPVPQRPHYVLERALGTGGYGEVWLTRHQKTGEPRVFKFCLDARELGALKREVTVYRLLTGTLGPRKDLARILDWDFTGPPFFIEMEYTPGGSLLDYFERRGDAGAVSLEDRIDIVAQVAESVGAAHSVGVLHKDIKPANILVLEQAAGRVTTRLTDFGSGFLLDPEPLGKLGITRAGFTRKITDDDSTSGTPYYMAPEVAAGQPPTIQADVYALGVLLYQIVLGDFQRPLAAGWEVDIPDELLREDIAAAANGDPSRRLKAARELSERLRSLEGRRAALEASREAERQAERQRLALARARTRRRWLSGLAAVLVLGLGLSTWLFLDSRRAWREAHNQAANASALSDFLTDDLLAAADPFQAPNPQMTVREAADKAARNLEARFGTAPMTEAAIRAALGRIYFGLGELDVARQHYQRARDLHARHETAPTPDSLALMANLGEVEGYQDRFEEARALFTEGLSASRERLGESAPRTLWFRAYLAWLDYREGRHESAISALQEIRAGLPAREVALPELRDFVLEWLMLALVYQGRTEEGHVAARELRDLRVSRYGVDHPASLWAMSYLGGVKRQLGDYVEAERLLEESLHGMRAWLGDSHPSTLIGQYELAGLYTLTGRYEAAFPLLEEVIARRTEQAGPDHQEVHYAMNALGYAYQQAGKNREAVEVFRRLQESAIPAFGERHPDVLVYRANFADAHLAAGDLARAGEILDGVLRDGPSVFPPGHFRLGAFRAILGRLRIAQGRPEEARVELEAALTQISGALGEGDARVRKIKELLDSMAAGDSPPAVSEHEPAGSLP